MQNWYLLTVPKSVAITNPRLNCLFYVLFLGTFSICLLDFIVSKQWSAKVQLRTRTLLEFAAESGPSTTLLNITGHSMCPPSKNVEAAETLLGEWSNLSVVEKRQRAKALWAPVHWLKGGTLLLQASSTCLPMCSGKADPAHCLSPLTFMDQRDSSHAAVWSSKHVLRSDGPFVHTYVGLSVLSTSLVVRYSYQLERAVPSLSQYVLNPVTSGDHTMTRTVLLDSRGVPGKRFPSGAEVKLTLKELLNAAQNLPQQLLQGTEPAWEVFRDGLELNVEVQCYNDDTELSSAGVDQSGNDAEWTLGATSKLPVCVLQVKFVRCCSTFAAPEVTAEGNVVMSRGVLVQASTSTTVMWLPSSSRLLLSFTSILVLLQVPLKVVRWFMLTFLGQLSQIYKRVIIEQFDIQKEAATMAVNLMSNSVSFLELSDCVTGKQEFPAVSRSRMEERLRAALQQQHHVLNDSEISAFVSCCFESLQLGVGDRLAIGREPDISTISTPSSCKGGEVAEDVIDIDTFNMHCSTGNAVDLRAAVEFFDQDRYRCPLEWLFTPQRLEQALQKVKNANQPLQQETPRKPDFFEEMQRQQSDVPLDPVSVLDLLEHGITILKPLSGEYASKSKPSLEEKKTVHDHQRNSFQRLCTIVLDLMQRERDHTQAMKLQASEIETLRSEMETSRNCTSNLEAQLHKADVALQRLGLAENIKGEHLQKLQEKLVERIEELESSINDRLSTALSNNGLLSREVTGQSNPGVHAPTQSEQAIRLEELADRLAMFEVELNHSVLSAKKACQLLADELHKEGQCRHSFECRLANLEATVRMEPETPIVGKLTSHNSQARSASTGQQGAFQGMNRLPSRPSWMEGDCSRTTPGSHDYSRTTQCSREYSRTTQGSHLPGPNGVSVWEGSWHSNTAHTNSLVFF